MREGSFKYYMVEAIMESQYFYGLSQIDYSEAIISSLCSKDCYYYLYLILKYSFKNEICIINGINYKALFDNEPLIKLIKSKHCNIKWLNLLLFNINYDTNDDNNININNINKKYKINQKTLTIAKLYTKNRLNNIKWENIIIEYENLINQENEKEMKQK